MILPNVNPEELKDRYGRHLASGLEVYESHGEPVISTPFLYPDGHCIELLIERQAEGRVTFSDMGQSLSLYEDAQVGLTSMRQAVVGRILRVFDVDKTPDDPSLRVTARVDRAPEAIHRLVQAAQAVSHFHYSQARRRQRMFAKRVREFVAPRVMRKEAKWGRLLNGKRLPAHRIDFGMAPRPAEGIDVYVLMQLVSGVQKARTTMIDWMDLGEMGSGLPMFSITVVDPRSSLPERDILGLRNTSDRYLVGDSLEPLVELIQRPPVAA